MRAALLFSGLLLVSVNLIACSSDNGSSSSGGGDDTTSSSTTSTGTNTGSGGAGQGGAGAGQGGGGQGGGGPQVKADHLGEICNGNKACPPDYFCAVISMGAANGFCTLKCNGATDMTTCSDGFLGPGKGICNIQLKDPQMNMFTACGIACGDQYMPALPTDCPSGLTCKDLTGMNMMPDGKTDLCSP